MCANIVKFHDRKAVSVVWQVKNLISSHMVFKEAYYHGSGTIMQAPNIKITTGNEV